MKYVRVLDTSKPEIGEEFGVYVGKLRQRFDGAVLIKVKMFTESERVEFERLRSENSCSIITCSSDGVVWERAEKIKAVRPKPRTDVYYVVWYRGYHAHGVIEDYDVLEVCGGDAFEKKQDALDCLRVRATANGFSISKNGFHAYKKGVEAGYSEEIHIERKVGAHAKGDPFLNKRGYSFEN